MRNFAAAIVWLCLAVHCRAAEPLRTLDDFRDSAAWRIDHTDDVAAAISSAHGKSGRALRLTFDFDHVNGYATAHRALPLDLPANYEISFWVRGASPVNNLQFKLIDASGENVWWLNRPDFVFPQDWQQIRVRKRDLTFAWGPASDHELKHSAAVEFVVSSGRDGGKGFVEFDRLTIRELPLPDMSPLRPRLTASSSLVGAPAAAAFDADMNTAWRSDPAQGSAQHLEMDFGKPRELGGLIVHWREGDRAQNWSVKQSVDGQHWHACAGYELRSSDDDALTLCDEEVRYLRLDMLDARPRGYGITEVELEPAGWGATPNAFFQEMAKRAPRGTYPRGFVEQPYWTIVGVDGGAAPALISEDGAIEPRKGSWSIEPFLIVDGKRIAWADVNPTQSLAEGYLPIPGVTWITQKLRLDIETFARGERDNPQLVVRYRVYNVSAAPLAATLLLAVRPFQVNPPMQFLNAPGGVAAIQDLRDDGSGLQVDGVPLWSLSRPDGFGLLNADGAAWPCPAPRRDNGEMSIHDASGHLSAALTYNVALAPGAARDIVIVVPMSGAPKRPELDAREPGRWFDSEREAVAAHWRERLNHVTLKLPASAQRIADSLRTALAHILISRDGAALRPGTRSYARSWIRDGAMMADALLRVGEIDAVREYVNWYAPHQFANGKVPCCVDHRGSDPVPENDSHGELIHAIAQLYRYSADRDELQRQWPRIAAAISYMDQLRAGETGSSNAAFKGLLPASISHEGYSAKPMHSYWDDFWALTGYKDAAAMADILGLPDADRIARARDAFAADLHASIATAARGNAIDYVPGCAELGDFDATSTTIALAPAGEQTNLPDSLLRNTFERYWREFVARRDGARAWQDYTPYEWRTVGAFVRLGWRTRAQELIDFFFRGARPPAWNQWAEVVGRDPRQSRFIGDMPHAWVASDFMRSALDLFAYERGDALVLAAGVPTQWLDGAGIAVEHLPTPFGELSYTLQRRGRQLELRIAAGIKPPGGFVLPWPFAGSPKSARINGSTAHWQVDELPVQTAPAVVVVDTPER
jgi:hypothetical protein